MCAVSYVSDFYPKQWPKPRVDEYIIPYPWPNTVPNTSPEDIFDDLAKLNKVMNYKTKTQFSEWSFEQCEAYVELMEKALNFDLVNNEPKCSDPEKVKVLDVLISRLEEIGLEFNPKAKNKNARKCLGLIGRIETLQERLK